MPFRHAMLRELYLSGHFAFYMPCCLCGKSGKHRVIPTGEGGHSVICKRCVEQICQSAREDLLESEHATLTEVV